MTTRGVVVTGGASGIGAETCRALSRSGFAVAVLDLDEIGARAVADELSGRSAVGIECDVTDSGSVRDAITKARAELGRIDGLVACAGIVDPAPVESMSDVSWNRMIDIHLGGTFRAAREVFASLRESGGGSIVAVSSIAAHTPIAQRASYASAKGGIESFVRALAVEWARHGIRVNAVAPGYVNSPMMEKAIESGALDRGDIESRISRVPMGRLAGPDEVARAIVFLLGEAASFVTGQVLFVDGGIVINGTYGV